GIRDGHVTGVQTCALPILTEPNTCLVSENFAALNKSAAGDTIEIQGPGGPVPLRILGVVPEYSWPRGTILVDRVFYARAFRDPRSEEHTSELQSRGHLVCR